MAKKVIIRPMPSPSQPNGSSLYSMQADDPQLPVSKKNTLHIENIFKLNVTFEIIGTYVTYFCNMDWVEVPFYRQKLQLDECNIQQRENLYKDC